MQEFIYFFHFVGIIIGLGAVTVIDAMGFFSRNDKKKTQDTISAHHTTKPLIWLGTSIVIVTWILMIWGQNLTGIYFWKSLLLFIMILNGCFLSFVIKAAHGLFRLPTNFFTHPAPGGRLIAIGDSRDCFIPQ